MDRLDTMKIFVRVVEVGSFSAVGREMGIGQPAVSKQVAALEQHLGAQLLRRTSRKLSLTEAGQDFYEAAVRVIQEVDAATSRIGHGQAAPSGLVRATVSPGFGRFFIVPRLTTFFARYPEVSVELLASERTANLIEDGIDVALRNGELSDSSLVARKIGSTAAVLVASPDYLAQAGEPAGPSGLEDHEAVIFVSQTGPRAWAFKGKFGLVRVTPRGRFRTNDPEQMRVAVLAGLGIAQVPRWLFAEELDSGAVRRILRDYEPGDVTISAVRPAGRRLPSKVAVFIDFLAEVLTDG